MIDFNTPLQGMRAADARLDGTASRIAREPLQTAAQGFDSVDLSSEMVNLIKERNDFEANVKVVQTQDEMLRGTLRLIG